MDGDPVAIARMYERHAHFLQVENNTLHRDRSAKYEECLSLRQVNTALKTDNTRLRKRIAELTVKSAPPAANLPHAQLGINALATAAVMRVCYRLPLHQIIQLFENLPATRPCRGVHHQGTVARFLGRPRGLTAHRHLMTTTSGR